jgi:hypothetical protein
MKTALFLCILFGAALVLDGCAAQNTADVAGTGANRSTVPGISGSLGGGGGHPPNQGGMAHIP